MSDDNLGSDATIRGFREGQRVFGRYMLQRVLGRGGMGVVWLARDEELERLAAIKFLPELIIMDPEALRDLKRETRRNLDITHANIVRIYDFEQDATGAGITMEYVEGETLGALKVKSPNGCLDAETVAPWLVQICDALHYAHTKPKVAHRDLKPANIMLQKDGEIKVTDFGIASSISDTVSRVSMRAGSSGTPVFMSPQQALGERPTARDDIYSLGATIYDLLTGKPPFYTGQLMHQLEHVVPPLMRDRRAELEKSGSPIPEVWEEVVAACLAKNPADRPASVKEVGERLAGAWSVEPAVPQMVEHDVTVPDSGAGTGGEWVPEPEEVAVTPEVLREALGMGAANPSPVSAQDVSPRSEVPAKASSSVAQPFFSIEMDEGGVERWWKSRWAKWVLVVVALGMVLNWVEKDRAATEEKPDDEKERRLTEDSQRAIIEAEQAQKVAEAKAAQERRIAEAVAKARLEAEQEQKALEARQAEEAEKRQQRPTDEVSSFFQTMWGHQASNQESEWALDFADEVRYCYSDEPMVGRDFIRMDRAKLIRDWPVREYRLSEYSPPEFVGKKEAILRYVFDYEYKNGRGKSVRGTCAVRLGLAKVGGEWKITAYDETVKRSGTK